MRIISGDLKGRKIKAVPGTGTRPTSDKIRESIFNMIGPFFNGGQSLDLYGGSGALTIEGVSRGIEQSIIIDVDSKAIDTIKENVKSLNLDQQIDIFKNDSYRALKALRKREMKFKYVFLDPPYKKQKIQKEIEYLAEHHLLEPQALIVTEHDAKLILPEQISTLKIMKHEKYNSTTAVTIYVNENEGTEIDE
ncbi:16S rRNA (guanine(966)-N(2))-methyltransferase RsmD [Pseudalkalibacillus berkeleyi]|uniref:16S rRNA (Guanine(966)-N(2))-methyltransferase RsmD n=1 Tax=Pseudalkalibacillus berkeleyi TaxID=1069813 RepID=A0ABS9GZR5_9BACL|nr:16S rRNA (guanine(966)-N(2))-methyltransferase RsmD [Pseudalkalibacillus berkeleyi]MCF6136988.1 16S rRNA (guanine(966)-N(2))-methyltransferase RsmD [Pseudalkalibacillus berkeleyi]